MYLDWIGKKWEGIWGMDEDGLDTGTSEGKTLSLSSMNESPLEYQGHGKI